jgi:hypothetical protein
MLAHQLSDYQHVDLLSKVDPPGGCKPSDLLVAMIKLCPWQHVDSPFFLYFFLQRLPCEIHVLLVEEDTMDVCRIRIKADRLVALHVPQHHDAVATVAPSFDNNAANSAAPTVAAGIGARGAGRSRTASSGAKNFYGDLLICNTHWGSTAAAQL